MKRQDDDIDDEDAKPEVEISKGMPAALEENEKKWYPIKMLQIAKQLIEHFTPLDSTAYKSLVELSDKITEGARGRSVLVQIEGKKYKLFQKKSKEFLSNPDMKL